MICSIFIALFIVHMKVMGMDEKVLDNADSSNNKPASAMAVQKVKESLNHDGYDKYGLEHVDESYQDDNLYPMDDNDSNERASDDVLDEEKRARIRIPWQFAFAKRRGPNRFAFAKRASHSRFAFAKRRGPSRFAFAKRSTHEEERDLEKRRSKFAFAKRYGGRPTSYMSAQDEWDALPPCSAQTPYSAQPPYSTQPPYRPQPPY